MTSLYLCFDKDDSVVNQLATLHTPKINVSQCANASDLIPRKGCTTFLGRHAEGRKVIKGSAIMNKI